LTRPPKAEPIGVDGVVVDRTGESAFQAAALAQTRRFRRLLARAQAGDAEAFTELYEERRGRLMRIAMLVLHDAAASEDVVQESWINAWQAVGRAAFDTPAEFGAWLGVIVGRAALSALRRRRCDASLDERRSSGNGHEPATDRDVADQVVEEQFVAALLAALRPADRRLLLLSLAFSRRELLALLTAEEARPMTMPVLRQRLSRAARAARATAARLDGA
jgi:RNA polymerase sigma-70 factor (ECF subfamily)